MSRNVLVSSVLALVASASIAATGCNRDPAAGEVQGTVTLDGTPVENGTIRFTPIEGLTGTAGGTISKGQFAVVVPVANHRVQISAIQLPPGTKAPSRHSDGNYSTIEIIPAKYNASSELTLDVKAGVNKKSWDLKSR